MAKIRIPDPGERYTDEEIKLLDKKIQSIYSEAQRDIQSKMDDFNQKFEKKDAMYRKQLEKKEITQEQYDNWKKGQVFTGKQWAAKKDEITKTLNNSNKLAVEMINNAAPGVFAENSNYMAYGLEHTAGVNFGFNLYNTQAVARLIKDDPDILPKWKINEKKDYTWNKQSLNNAVTQGIIQGESLDKISKRVGESLAGKNENLMKTFAKTGMTQAQNSGRLERLKQADALGIECKKKWVATLDARTRMTHQALDGQVVPTNEAFEVPGAILEYPGDPSAPAKETYNCRCALTFEFGKYPSDKYQRRDNAAGKPIDKMTYNEWKASKKSEKPKTKATTTREVRDIMTLKNYNQTYDAFKAKREASIEDITPFKEMNDLLTQLIENNEFRMRVPDDDGGAVLSSVLTDGRFKTQFETISSGGSYNPTKRLQASQHLFGHDGNIEAKDFEKYGYLGSKDIIKDDIPNLVNYGGTKITFKKDNMMDRTTFTVGDSLRDADGDGTKYRFIMGSKVTDPDSIVAISRYNSIDDYLKLTKLGIDEYGITNADKIGSDVRSYFELQYHGDLTLNDVESITTKKSILEDIKSDEDLSKIAKESKIKFKYIENGKVKDFEF